MGQHIIRVPVLENRSHATEAWVPRKTGLRGKSRSPGDMRPMAPWRMLMMMVGARAKLTKTT